MTIDGLMLKMHFDVSGGNVSAFGKEPGGRAGRIIYSLR